MAQDATQWQEVFPDLHKCADDKVRALMTNAQRMQVPAAKEVFTPGAECRNYLLVLDGSVRVQLLTASGREIVLYHVNRGDSCVLTTSCLLGGDQYPAVGITREPVTALALPAEEFHVALDESAAFRQFVFARLGKRLAEVMGRIEEVAFGPIDARLARSLLDLSGEQALLTVTHQQLAAELGSAREVISRHLKRFEERGLVRLGRGTIALLDRARLAEQAALV